MCLQKLLISCIFQSQHPENDLDPYMEMDVNPPQETFNSHQSTLPGYLPMNTIRPQPASHRPPPTKPKPNFTNPNKLFMKSNTLPNFINHSQPNHQPQIQQNIISEITRKLNKSGPSTAPSSPAPSRPPKPGNLPVSSQAELPPPPIKMTPSIVPFQPNYQNQYPPPQKSPSFELVPPPKPPLPDANTNANRSLSQSDDTSKT